MKTILYLLVSVLCFAGCSKDAAFDSPSDPGMYLHVYVDNQNTTRAIIEEENGVLRYKFKAGDRATSYSVKSGYVQSDLQFDESSGCFEGFYVTNMQNEIAVVYPQQVQQPANGRILLGLPGQDGTLSCLSNTAYQWGFATLSEKNGALEGYTTMAPLLAICRFNFTSNGSAVSNITSIRFTASKGAFYENRNLQLSAGTLEDGGTVNEIVIKNIDGMNPQGEPVYVGFFPSAFGLSVEVTDAAGNIYEGVVEENRYVAGQYNRIDAIITKTGTITPDDKDYVEVCGIQWAKGNLMYEANLYGNTGYREHWQIASSQWYYPDAVSGYQSASVMRDFRRIAHFNWGVLNDNALSSSLYATYYGDIAGKLYFDKNCQQQTSDFASAKYGDLAYWATNGEYRLPTETEMYKLFSEASYSFGYYTTSSGMNIYGFLFRDSEGDQVIDSGLHYYSDADLQQHLFLPASGNREYNSDVINRMGCCGYYWDSRRDKTMYQLTCNYRDVIWRQTSAFYGRSIRPVKNILPPVEEEVRSYVEICGVKWAKGNLQYGSSFGTTNGFQADWSVAKAQWAFPDAGVGFKDTSASQAPNAVYHFNWGVCGDNAISTSLFANYHGDISGRMFVDRNCTQETRDMQIAQYGDVAFWASNGKYRMPTQDEIYKLFSEASYSRGVYVDSSGRKTYGFLFKTPEEERVVEVKSQIYTDYDLEHYLFLPAAGNRQYKSSDIYRIGCCGFYFDATREAVMNQLTLSYSTLLWRSTDPAYGRTIRPVFLKD